MLFAEDIETTENVLPVIVMGITILLWLVATVVTLALLVVFHTAYRRILNRAPSDGEIPEITNYRRKTREGKAGVRKSMLWPTLLLTAGIAVMIVAVGIDFVQNAESEELGQFSYF